MSHRLVVAVAVVAALLLLPSSAGAVDYPPPGNPSGAPGKPKGPFRTLHVCKGGKRCFPRIQDAVNEARPGDVVQVARGTWRETVTIRGARKRFVRLIGDRSDPGRVVLDGQGRRGTGVLVAGADEVTVDGFTARRFRTAGFAVTGATGFTLRRLVAHLPGSFGILVADSRGGAISRVVARWAAEAGIAVTATPPQAKPLRTTVREVTAFGNVTGWSGTNARYVTVMRSSFYNNATGVAITASEGAPAPPAEQIVVTDNDIFWNNFNAYKSAPYAVPAPRAGSVAAPVGAGVLLLGGRANQVIGNRVFGNFLLGVGAVPQLASGRAEVRELVGNQVRDNAFGLGGADPNARDLVYDGSGADNCFAPNAGVARTLPESGATMPGCPFTGANAFDQPVQDQVAAWLADPTHEAFRIVGPHVARESVTPLESYGGGVV